MNRQACPTKDVLEQFLEGALPDPPASSVESHWKSCSLCEGTVIELESANDTFVRQFKQLSPSRHDQDDPAVRQVLARLHVLDPLSLAMRGSVSDGEASGRGWRACVMPALGQFGAYDLLEQIGRGGMGTVYRARHRRLDQEVAIKIVPGGQIQNSEIIARFDREMKAIGRLKHPNLVQAQDAGETEGNEFLYLVMELLDGVDAATILRRGQVPIADACEIARQAAMALRYVHTQRQVHRDVKPSNLMVTRDAAVKLLDLGLALLSDAQDHALTTGGQIMGTLDYMAPEQAGNSHEVDSRADVYSLGCTLFALLIGTAPFTGSEYSKPAQKILAHATIAPPSAKTRRPELPDDLADLTNAMLHKDPARRPSLDEILDRLVKHCQGAALAALVTNDVRSAQRPYAEPVERGHAVSHQATQAGGMRRGWKFWTSIAAMLLLGSFGFSQVVLIIKNSGKKERVEIGNNQTAMIDGKTGTVTVSNVPRDNTDRPAAAKDSLPILGSRALVAEPRKLPGVESWTIETTAPRGEIISARFSPDGRRVAAWSQDGVLRVWNATTGDLTGMFPVPDGYLSQHPLAFDFSPDGGRLVLAAGNMRVWEIDSGRIAWQWNSTERILPREHFRVAWSPDGRWIATDKLGPTDGHDLGGRNIQIWNAETGAREKTLLVAQAEHATESSGVFNWSPDSTHLAVASEISNTNVSFELFDLTTGKRVQARTIEIPAGWNQFAFMAWSTDSKRIAATAEGVVIVWDAEAWRELDRIASGQNPRAAIRWLNAGQTLAIGEFHYRYTTDQATAQPGTDVIQNPSEQTICDWAPDGSRILRHDSGYASTLTVVDASNATQRLELTRPIRPLSLQGNPFRREWQSNDVIRFEGFAWNIKTGRRLEQVGPLATEDAQAVIAPSPDGNWLLVGAQPPVLRRRDGSRPDRELVDLEQPIAPFGGVACAVWSSDSRKVCVTGENCVRTWDAETGALLGRIQGASEVAVFSPSGKEIFSGGPAEFRVRTIPGELPQEFPKPPTQYNVGGHTGAAIWTSDGLRWRVIQSHGRIIEWNAQTGQEVSRNRFRLDNLFSNPPWRGITSPDERTMACAGASCVWLFSTDTLRSVGTIVQLGERWLFVYPDGRIDGEYYPDQDLRYVVLRNGALEMMTPTRFQNEFPNGATME